MYKSLNGVLSVLALAGLLSISSHADAQTQQVQDLLTEQNTGAIATALTGGTNPILTDMRTSLAYLAGDFGRLEDALLGLSGEGGADAQLLFAITGDEPGNPEYHVYNTNMILSGGALSDDGRISPVSRDHNVVALLGGVNPAVVQRATGAGAGTTMVGSYDVYSAANFYNMGTYFNSATHNVNSLLQNALMGPSATGPQYLFATSTGDAMGAIIAMPGSNSALADMMDASDRSVDSAVAKSAHFAADALRIGRPTMENDGVRAFRFRCDIGFNPTYDRRMNDPESDIVLAKSPNCNRSRRAWARRDRSLESLLAPLQYLAPANMQAPTPGSPLYYRFSTDRFEDEDLPVAAAASFCQNIALKAYPEVPKTTGTISYDVANTIVYRESVDGRVIANCWHFFEERVQYRGGMTERAYQDAHDAQVARCTDDWNKHIISTDDLNSCRTNGRSLLKARADVAYRMNSPTYITYLNTLGVATRETIMAQALGEPERFEQNLLLERQIMTESMNIIERSAIGKSTDNASTPVTR
jgi:hypothetical protein